MYIGLVVVWRSRLQWSGGSSQGRDPEIEDSKRLHASFSLASILSHNIQHFLTNMVLLHRAMEILHTSSGENILQQFHVISDSKLMS